MTGAWINLSTRWGLPSVQAAINVVISVVGTVGIWAWSRYWWQRGSAAVVGGNSKVRLAAMCTPSGLGESWDVVSVLQKRMLDKENWHLLLQLAVILLATAGCVFSGPIAQVSLRVRPTVQRDQLQVLPTNNSYGWLGDLQAANVLWNETITSLDEAGFPYDQILDYLPPSTAPWIFVAREWEPSWQMNCNFQNETPLYNVTGVGHYNFYEPLDAFPAYRDTYDQKWLNSTNYRVQADSNSWHAGTIDFQDALFYVLVVSEPTLDNQMFYNNQTLEMSFSVLHLRDFSIDNGSVYTNAESATWEPIGPVGKASYSRLECNLTRNWQVPDSLTVSWVWTNDTYSITLGYSEYYYLSFQEAASNQLPVAVPTPEEILRLYQAYMISINILGGSPIQRSISVLKDTVQLSAVLLVIVLILTLLTLFTIIRYFVFHRTHHKQLDEVSIPKSKIDWMVHVARISSLESEVFSPGAKVKDRDYLQNASFGLWDNAMQEKAASLRHPSLARVQTSGGSIFSGRLKKDASSVMSQSAKKTESSVPQDVDAPQSPKTSGKECHPETVSPIDSQDAISHVVSNTKTDLTTAQSTEGESAFE